MRPGQQQALARRRHVQEQLALERRPARALDDGPCSICRGQGGWLVRTDDDGHPLPEPGEWIECWACDQPRTGEEGD